MTDTNSAAALDLAPILARVNAAEPGPWRVVEDHGRDITDEGWSLITVQSEAGDRPEVAEMISDEVASASELPLENAEFIAHARTDVLNMAAEIERLRSDGLVWSVAPEPDVPAVRDRHDRVWVRTEYSKAPTAWWLGKHGAGIPHSWHELLGGYGPLTAADAAGCSVRKIATIRGGA